MTSDSSSPEMTHGRRSYRRGARTVTRLAPLLLWALAAPSLALEPGDRVDNFMLLDHEGGAYELHYLSDKEAVVIMVQGNGCPIVRNVLPRLAEIRDEYAEQGVAFLLINSNLQDSRETIATEAEEYAIDFPIMIDESQLIGESMGFERTAEVFLIDPSDRWRLAYRGPVDDRVYYERQRPEAKNHYLIDALDAVLAGEPVETARVDAEGCLINFPSRYESRDEISYSEEIAPILVDNCVSCHRPGGIAPWSMTDYDMVRGFAPMIREVVRTGRMPPWHADPHYGDFANDRSLSIEEKQTLVRWIEAGAPRGEGPDPLVAEMDRDWPEWTLGEPDVIVELPPFDVPATGVIPYQHPVVVNPLDEEVWVRAVDFIPGDREVVHHIIASYRGEDDALGGERLRRGIIAAFRVMDEERLRERIMGFFRSMDDEEQRERLMAAFEAMDEDELRSAAISAFREMDEEELRERIMSAVSGVDRLEGDGESSRVQGAFLSSGGGERSGRGLRNLLGEGFGGFVPGGGPTIYPEEVGVRLPPDARFVLQMHYTPSGRAVTDVTRMGIYLRDEPPEHERQSTVLMNPQLRIPPHAKRHTESASRTFERDIVVYSLLPHAHYRGRASSFRAVYPDGSEEILLSVPNYDFNWQHTYVLEEPKHLPAGTTIVHETTWDNSAQNRANPDPSAEVTWGLQSWEEMLFGAVEYRYADDEEALAAKGSEAEPGGLADAR